MKAGAASPLLRGPGGRCGRPAEGIVALEGVAVAPGVGVDVDLVVAVLGEAVLVAAADDVEEDVGGTAVAGKVAEFVEDQERGPGIAV